jgi:hypothetical protein
VTRSKRVIKRGKLPNRKLNEFIRYFALEVPASRAAREISVRIATPSIEYTRISGNESSLFVRKKRRSDTENTKWMNRTSVGTGKACVAAALPEKSLFSAF